MLLREMVPQKYRQLKTVIDKWKWVLFQYYRNISQFRLSATAFYRQDIVEIYIPFNQLVVSGWLLDVVVAWWLS